jgi:hypothetical protein
VISTKYVEKGKLFVNREGGKWRDSFKEEGNAPKGTP